MGTVENAISTIIKKSVTATGLLRDPKEDQWVVYELARTSIASLLEHSGNNAMYEGAIFHLTTALEDAVKDLRRTS